MKKIILPLSLILLLTISSCKKTSNGTRYPGKMTKQDPCPGGCK